MNTLLGHNAKIFWWTLVSASIITLFFNPSLQDPFNSPKLWILMLSGSWICGFVISDYIKYKPSEEFRMLLISSAFIISLLISSLLTDVKFTAFFGEGGRRIGFITYFFFVVYMLATSRYITFELLPRFFQFIFLISGLTVLYGFLQATGNDFVKWNNPYNSIFTTFGNPNFSSAGMALFAILCLSCVFINVFNMYARITCLILVALLLYLIYRSDSRQGLVSFVLGASLIIVVFLLSKNRFLGISAMLITFILGVLSVLGMLQTGPFERFLYKPSVSVRGFYWRAGLEMFGNNPLTGVGIDRYGVYFRQFRESQYSLNYGFEISSSNAHNIPIQLFSTGGIFVGMFYCVLNFFIFYRGIIAIRNFKGNKRLLVTGLFAAWLSFQAQALISIENIGLGIWGWILGGAIIGLASDRNSIEIPTHSLKRKSLKSELNLYQLSISGVVTIISVLLVSALYTGERDTINARLNFNPEQVSQTEQFYLISEKVFNNPFNEPYYKLVVSELVNESDRSEKAYTAVNNLHLSDPYNYVYLRALAIMNEQNKQYSEAIKFRRMIEKIDPWNSDNYLGLGLNYKAILDYESMSLMLDKILMISPQHPIAAFARDQLKP
jgi:O-antigen ligase